MTKRLSFLFILCLLLPACKNGGVEGAYSYDKQATLKNYHKLLNSLPKNKRKFARQGYASLRSLNIMLYLRKDGKVEMKVSMKLFNQRSKKTYKGTWSKKGKLVLVTTERQRQIGQKIEYYKQTISCAFSEGNLACSGKSKGKTNKQKLYFRKS